MTPAPGDFLRQRMAQVGELTLDELCVELDGRGVSIHRSNVGRLLYRLGLSHKKTLRQRAAAA
jgi:transposase